jgi:UDP-N-acetylglucosamine 4,6-dehydratase
MNKLDYLKNKTVLVTGGTGTFGRAFVSKLLKDSEVKKIIIFSRDEFKQSNMQNELFEYNDRLRFFIGDIRDLQRLERAFEGVDIVFHAAALKQVPAIEYNPFEAVKTNILGSQNVIEAALDNHVDKVILISSDKAVQPVNLYGATKLAAERLFVAANSYSGRKTKFGVVRYGNVIGSRGSLIEMIKQQRDKGEINLTDKEMTRFWISIDKVLGIILEAVENMHGGEIFVPKMKSLKVSDVIKYFAPECKIKLIGMRPGEKMHEILITEYEAKRTVNLENVFVIKPEFDFSQRGGWLKNKKLVDSDFEYSSNNSEFILSLEKAGNVLNI